MQTPNEQLSPQEQLANDLAITPWGELKPHAKRDAIIVVHEGLDLLEVAIAIAEDQVSVVNRWVEEKLIAKPTEEQLGEWNQIPSLEFKTLIVQPFVLICPQ
jgi:hypothetical protein